MKALGVVGKTRLRVAKEKWPSVAQHWYGQWCFCDTGKNGEVKCSVQDLAVVPALIWQKARVARGAISLAGDWQEIVFGAFAHEVPVDKTAMHLLREAQLALLNEVLEALGQGSVSHLTAETSAPFASALNAQVLLQLSIAQSSLYLLLDASLLNNSLVPAIPRRELIERKRALGNARVKLSIRLPLASLSIGEMNDLHPGDTLRASSLLIDPVSVQVKDGPVVASGYLARQRDHLAVQLISNE